MTMERIGEEMGHMWFESQIYEKGKEIILSKIDGEKIVRNDDGAVIGKIEQEYGVPDVVLIKSDGTALYHTQDLYLTLLKIEKFNPWKAIWIVGNEQITHFQRLFSLIDSINLMPIDNLYHLAYGFVFDKDGKKMSSRTGDALSADELIDIVKEKVMLVMKDRKMDLDLDDISESIAIGALKYAFLSSDPFKDMRFDIESSTSFNGKSGPYIMYSYARAKNILKKITNTQNISIEGYEMTDLAKELSMKCLEYSDVIVEAANNYSPSLVAEYLFELAKLFNQYYEVENVLGSKGSELKFKEMLVILVSEILKDGLSLLKISSVDVM
jgi:arginyl-tRNA synthetase